MGRKMAARRRRDVENVTRVLSEGGCDVMQSQTPGAYRKKRRAPIKPRNDVQGELLAAMETATIVFAIGPAGTGKTYLAISKAVELLASQTVERIILSRPAVEAAGEKLGFLPGDLRDKLDPYLRPLYDVLYERLGGQTVEAMIRNGQIEISPLAFMRGRTFTNSVIVLDEAQNATASQLKMALTRIGEDSRMIVTGDPDQSDLAIDQNALDEVSRKLSGTPGIETVHFEREHVVRSRIVADILRKL